MPGDLRLSAAYVRVEGTESDNAYFACAYLARRKHRRISCRIRRLFLRCYSRLRPVVRRLRTYCICFSRRRTLRNLRAARTTDAVSSLYVACYGAAMNPTYLRADRITMRPRSSAFVVGSIEVVKGLPSFRADEIIVNMIPNRRLPFDAMIEVFDAMTPALKQVQAAFEQFGAAFKTFEGR